MKKASITILSFNRCIYLKNTILDSTKNRQLYQLIDEKSILLKDPESGVIIY
jgi:hypothetical protein